MTQTEERLKKWIISLDERGGAPRHPQVREMANILLCDRGVTPPTTVGDKWVYNFIKRHPELCTPRSRRYNYQRAANENPVIIRSWFEQVQNTILEFGVDNHDIYNFDETGFAMGLAAIAVVVTRADFYGKKARSTARRS